MWIQFFLELEYYIRVNSDHLCSIQIYITLKRLRCIKKGTKLNLSNLKDNKDHIIRKLDEMDNTIIHEIEVQATWQNTKMK